MNNSNINLNIFMLKTNTKLLKIKLEKFKNKRINSSIVQQLMYKKWKIIII